MKKLFSTLLVVLFATSLMAQTGLTCEDPIPVDSNYNAYVTVDPEEGYKEVWYTAGTYDLPLNVHFIPDNPNSDWGPDVTIDLTCTPGVYDDPMIDSLINLNKLNTNFVYTVKASSGTQTFNAYVHDWARVSNLDESFFLDGNPDENTDEKKDFLWAKSINEKWKHIKETFDKALSEQTNGNTIFINSLCGYFIDKTEVNSYLPNLLTDISVNYSAGTHKYSVLSGSSTTAGMCGNISDYAKWVNNEFYNYLLTKDLGGKSTGIIMMDRVSNKANANPAGYYIPRIILANNPFAPGQIAPEGPVPPVTGEGDDDIILAPARRDATNNDNISVVWK